MVSIIPFTLSFLILAVFHVAVRAGYGYFFTDNPWAGGGPMWEAVTLSLAFMVLGPVFDLVSWLRRRRRSH